MRMGFVGKWGREGGVASSLGTGVLSFAFGDRKWDRYLLWPGSMTAKRVGK